MNNIFSAFGLLIENSFNLSGSSIDIDFKLLENGESSKSYDYVSIRDNSIGFSSD